MYEKIMAWLDSVLSQADKTKHHIVGSWLAGITMSALILGYLAVPFVPAIRTATQSLFLNVFISLLTIAVVWLVGLWNEREQCRLNRAAVAAGGIATHEVSDDDVKATVLGALPVLLPTIVLCLFQLYLLV